MSPLCGPTNVLFLGLLERRYNKFVNFERRFWKNVTFDHLHAVSFLLWQQNHQGNSVLIGVIHQALSRYARYFSICCGLRATDCGLRVAGHTRVAGCRPQIVGCRLRATLRLRAAGHRLRAADGCVAGCGPQIACCGPFVVDC